MANNKISRHRLPNDVVPVKRQHQLQGKQKRGDDRSEDKIAFRETLQYYVRRVKPILCFTSASRGSLIARAFSAPIRISRSSSPRSDMIDRCRARIGFVDSITTSATR